MENTLLNLIPAAYLPEIHLSQYDVGRTITFTLKDGASDYSVPSGASVKVKATKPSGFGFEVACTFNGGTVTLVTTETMTLEYGRFPAELSIVSGNTTIGTSNFIFNIERSPHPEGTIDGDAETILPELTLLVERIEAAADSVDADTQIVTEAKAEVLQAKADTLQAKADTLSARDESVSAKDLAVSSAQTSVEASQRAEELVGSVETKADAIVKSASGEVASFSDGGNGLLVKTLIANITPQQSGSGDPSPDNVRPISGWNSVNVARAGKNLLANNRPDSSTLGGITFTKNGDGTITANGTATTNVYFYLPNGNSGESLKFPKGDYILSGCPSGGGASTYYMQIWAKNGWHSDTGSGGAFTVDDTMTRSCAIAIRSGVTVNNVVFKPMIRVASDTDDTYEPYQGNTYPISLGQTVYGGTLEVMSGVLTIDRAGIVINQSTSFAYNGTIAGRCSEFYLTPTPTKAIGVQNLIADNMATNVGGGLSPYMVSGRNNSGLLLFYLPPTYTTTTQASEWLTSNPITVVYELATPTEVTLTPTQVTTLLGSNNIWADSGEVEVEYRADTTLAYNELLSLIASLS